MIPDPHRCNQLPAVIVTGASSGIGRSLALQLVKIGLSVIDIGRDANRLAALKTDAPSIETTVVFDLACITEVDALIAHLVARHPAIAGLINNAAVQKDVRLNDGRYGTAQIGNEIAINLSAPVALVRCLLPQLKSQPRATIVNVGSGLGFVPKRTSAVYSATKAGLHLFSEA